MGENATEAPIVSWFNGGATGDERSYLSGCSSMIGLFLETGPYIIKSGDANFTENLFPWNREVNVLYIDQPAGVGFSTCDGEAQPKDCEHTDASSALDNYNFLLAWFAKF